MLSGNRIIGHIITSQGGHALTNKLLLKFFSNKSNWSLKAGKSISQEMEIEETSKKQLSASL
jgi:UDP-3-O-acyl-N-acetylglucosamine deacetylase